MAGERLAALDEKIAVLEGARTALGRLRKTYTSGTKGPCPILAPLETLSGLARLIHQR